MILEKYKNRYSFNFLAICGWIVLLLFGTFVCPEIFIAYIIGNTQHVFAIGISLICIVLFVIICLIFAFFIRILELVFLIQINNMKFLNNKVVDIIQKTGIICMLSAVLFIICLLLVSIWEYVKYVKLNISI